MERDKGAEKDTKMEFAFRVEESLDSLDNKGDAGNSEMRTIETLEDYRRVYGGLSRDDINEIAPGALIPRLLTPTQSLLISSHGRVPPMKNRSVLHRILHAQTSFGGVE